MNKEELAQAVIGYLNDLLECDPEATQKLFDCRVPCNTRLADHPTIQVLGTYPHTDVGILGILNGFVGVIEEGSRQGWGLITAVYDEDGTLVKFVPTKKFLPTTGKEHT